MSSTEVLTPPSSETAVLRHLPSGADFDIYGPPLEELLPKVELLETDGDKLETEWHRLVIELLLQCLRNHLRDRDDYYAGGNMFIYFSETQARNLDYRGPDFFFVKNVERKIRPYWAVWQEEGRYPNAIIELASPSTIRTDRTVKKDIYEQTFRTPEYFLYDNLTEQLDGWRLDEHGAYRPLHPNDRGWLWSEQMQLWLGVWSGTSFGYSGRWLRFFDANGVVVPTDKELATREQQQKEEVIAEVTRLKELLAIANR